MRVALYYPKLAGKIFNSIKAEDFRDDWCKTAASILESAVGVDGSIDVSSMLSSIDNRELASQMSAISFSLEEIDCEDSELQDLINDCIIQLKMRPNRDKINDINAQIREAETDGKNELLLSLLEEKNKLIKKSHNS